MAEIEYNEMNTEKKKEKKSHKMRAWYYQIFKFLRAIEVVRCKKMKWLCVNLFSFCLHFMICFKHFFVPSNVQTIFRLHISLIQSLVIISHFWMKFHWNRFFSCFQHVRCVYVCAFDSQFFCLFSQRLEACNKKSEKKINKTLKQFISFSHNSVLFSHKKERLVFAQLICTRRLFYIKSFEYFFFFALLVCYCLCK